MKKLLVFFIAIAFLNVNIFAIGESGGLVFDINTGARPASMAGVFIAKADDANSIWYNPAGIANMSKYEIALTYDKNLLGMNNTWFSFIIPFQTIGSFGISVLYSSIQDIDNGHEDTPVKVYDIAGIAGYSYAFSKNLLAGLNIKYLGSYLGDYSSWGLGFDIGFLYYVNDKISLGLVCQNIGTSMKFDSEETSLPLRIGGGIDAKVLSLNEHILSFGMDVKYNLPDSYLTSGVAVEYLYNAMFALRLGYILEQNSLNGLTAGAGIQSVINNIKVKFDYAFIPHIWSAGEVDTTNMISIIVQF